MFVVGDFNCKSPWWGYTGTDHVGRTLQAFVEANDVAFLNEKGARQGFLLFSIYAFASSPPHSLFQ
jgi:hypothetical protein